MNTIRKIKHDVKALSPVVASIILIAVTVAVSIAVAAWMGALVVGQMDTEQIALGTPTFGTNSVQLVVKNTGTSALVIQQVYLNGSPITVIANPAALPFTIAANGQQTLNFTATIVTGANYQVKVVTAKNNPFLTTAIAPSS